MAFLSGVIEGFYGTPWKNSERKELFGRLQDIGLNTYMYAPKDDKKHRKLWRNAYTDQESKILKNLIETSKNHEIDFIYAISPGLDIVFTSPTDLDLLKEKLQQVHSLGCRSFALLFDDIDPELCLVDKMEYSSSADAQTTVANKLFEWFNDLNTVLFCPTEYCDTRAVPNIRSSEYLKIVGEKLNKRVKVLWTGPKVVSNNISVQSLENLNKVLQRKAVIWDNIHASDYDSRRIFLGPFKGRDLELYKHTSGVLTNPNCEYQTNFIPIESLAVWRLKAVASCSKLDSNEKTKHYDPEQTMLELCEKWITLFQQEQSVSLFHVSKNTNDLQLNSLVDEGNDSSANKNNSEVSAHDSGSSSEDEEEGDKEWKKKKVFGKEDLLLLCHFFYLPYEDGEKAREIISQFKWLKDNAIDYQKPPIQEKINRWHAKQTKFCDLCDEVSAMYDSFTHVKNQRIVQQLHAYVRDVNDTVHLLKKFVKFLGSKEREDGKSFVPEDPEAWYFRGGILGEMERLLPASNEEFLTSRTTTSMQTIRPYLPQDKEEVMQLLKELPAMSELSKEYSPLAYEFLLGAFVEDPLCHVFILEINDVISAVVAGCGDAQSFYTVYEKDYLPKIRSKYTLPSPSSNAVESKLLKRLHGPSAAVLPGKEVLNRYPGVVTMEFTPKSVTCIPQLLKCCLAYVKSDVHMTKYSVKKRRIEQYKEFGFEKLHSPRNNEMIALGYKV